MNKQNNTVLLVEDDSSLRELVTMLLDLEGYKVVVTENGQEALDYLSVNQVDLIILDLFMPVLDGLHVLNWLRKEKKLATPVLIMTAMTDEKTQKNIKAAGANGIIKKPLDVDKIVSAVNNILIS